MVIAFLLAQLVLPGPPSSPIQPPGMICASGSCERGPMVYRTSASRSRLVVACDMRSDTCSDGRKITTTRATPVPCEVAPGVWEMVPEDTGCYGVRGLESWGQNTSYLSYGAELDREPWGPTQSSVDIQPIGGGAVRVCNTDEPNSGIRQYLGNLTEPGIATGSIIARVYPPITGALIGVFQGVYGVVSHPGPVGSWAQMSFTGEGEEGRRQQLIVYPRPSSADRIDCIDIMAAWRTKTATPGRACWGGEAPVTCAGDWHRISTEGWPTEAGEISVTFFLGPSNNHQYIIDGRAAGDVQGKTLLLVERQNKKLRLDIVPGQAVTGPILEAGKWYSVKILVRDGRTRVLLDGVEVINVAGTPQFASTATIGNRFEQDESINGPIRSLRIRSYEEVSP